MRARTRRQHHVLIRHDVGSAHDPVPDAGQPPGADPAAPDAPQAPVQAPIQIQASPTPVQPVRSIPLPALTPNIVRYWRYAMTTHAAASGLALYMKRDVAPEEDPEYEQNHATAIALIVSKLTDELILRIGPDLMDLSPHGLINRIGKYIIVNHGFKLVMFIGVIFYYFF